MIVKSATAFGAGLTSLDGFQCPFHVLDLNRGPETESIIIIAVIASRDSFWFQYTNAIHCSETEKVMETLTDVVEYSFYESEAQVM